MNEAFIKEKLLFVLPLEGDSHPDAILREVPEDIPGLANHFLNTYCWTVQTDLTQFTPAASQSLLTHNWPGNARELENEAKRALASVRVKTTAEDHLDTRLETYRRHRDSEESTPPENLPGAVEQPKRRLIENTFRRIRQKQTKCGSGLRPERQGVVN
jgi:DNA-binding NtrC family response regulator